MKLPLPPAPDDPGLASPTITFGQGIGKARFGMTVEQVIEALEQRLDREPERMRVRRTTSEHPFGTLKAWMGATHFLTRTLDRVSTEMSLHVLAYNLKRVMNILGIKPLIQAMQA